MAATGAVRRAPSPAVENPGRSFALVETRAGMSVLGDLIRRGATNKRWGNRSWQVAVFLSYASSAGHALIDRELYLCERSRIS